MRLVRQCFRPASIPFGKFGVKYVDGRVEHDFVPLDRAENRLFGFWLNLFEPLAGKLLPVVIGNPDSHCERSSGSRFFSIGSPLENACALR